MSKGFLKNFYQETTMADLFDNPMGLDGFEFVEFAAPDPAVLENAFTLLGFTEVAKHRSKNVSLWRQGDINFIINNEPKSQAWYFAREHGPCACGMAFRVRDAHRAYNRALEKGAQPVNIPTGPMELRLPAIKRCWPRVRRRWLAPKHNSRKPRTMSSELWNCMRKTRTSFPTPNWTS